MRRLTRSMIVVAAIVFIGVPTQARADGYVSPWAGINFANGNADQRGTFGVNAGSMGKGVIGGEVSFGFSPSFWGPSSQFGTNSVLDLMGNVIVGIPIGGQHGKGLRPYATGGLGLIRNQADGGRVFQPKVSDNDFGWNAGAGVMGFFNDHVGLRGDVRYYRTINGNINDSFDFSSGDLYYWRGSFGLVIR